MSIITNKRLFHDYEIIEKYTCGIELFGHEVKSVKKNLVNIVGGKVLLVAGEVFVLGLDIHPYQENNIHNIKYDKLRTRKLLLKKKEIIKLYKIMEDKHLHLLPYSIFVHNNFIKVDIALCKKLNKHDKRDKIKQRDLNQSDFV
jgi:SsrA-binding protein